MNAKTYLRSGIWILLAACHDPFHFDNSMVMGPMPPDVCSANPQWFEDPNGTPPLELYLPLPHPATECPFYFGAIQNFLRAMQPDANGVPALFSYPTIDSIFKPKIPHGSERSVLGSVKQAGGRQIVIDQNGNTLYYGIHVNQTFADFIHENQLETADEIQAYPNDPVKSRLFFPAGVVEYKTAWQIVEGTDPSLTQNYITVQTTVPTLTQDPVTHVIKENRDKPRMVTVRLLAAHSVYTYPGHPEFIWGSFEHSTGTPDTKAADGHRDVAPIVPDDMNPTDADPTNSMNTVEVSQDDFLLYKAHTLANQGNQAIDETQLVLDEAMQKFPNQQTSIYRMFPASKSNTTDPDDDVSSFNHNLEALCMQDQDKIAANDKRCSYRLIGAQWMDKPRFFTVNIPIQNDASSPLLQDHLEDGMMVPAVSLKDLTNDLIMNGTQGPLSILGGEDRMSSTAMESFTQGPGSFNNCFTCHNTQAITAKGVPLGRDLGGQKLLDPGLLNVSHILSEFLLEESEAQAK
jgi:hypothetical protein